MTTSTTPRALPLFLLFLLATTPIAAQSGGGQFSYFPTQNVTDGRMMSFGCAGVNTLQEEVNVGLAVARGESDFSLSFFDGDTGKPSPGGVGHWDLGNIQLVYRLYFDPLRQANTTSADLVAEWTGNDPNPTVAPTSDPDRQWVADAAEMPDNAWWNASITTSPLAQAPSGNYFYNLEIQVDPAVAGCANLVSDLKIAASTPLSIFLNQFGFEASLRQPFNDGPIIYPDWVPPTVPDPRFFLDTPTTYDGTFTFFVEVPINQVELTVFDGDFDFGNLQPLGLPSGVLLEPCADTDDPDTDNFILPPFITLPTVARLEGIAGPGIPPDDNHFDFFRRGELGNPDNVGCVRYEVTDPNGVVYRNDNPSGNLEWEEFRIATASAPNPGDADHLATGASLPSGIWRIDIIGLDLSNLNFWRLPVCGTSEGVPLCPPPVFVVGDTVFSDDDGDGVQGAGNPGIAGVVVELIGDPAEPPIATATTGDPSNADWSDCLAHNTGLDTAGLYCFGIDAPGQYTVRIAASNFASGGALAGFTSTTGGETQTNTVSTGNVLTYDFGYQPPSCPLCTECPPDLDFETSAAGGSLARGTVITEQWAAYGIHVTTHDPVGHPAMIFDSGNPTGGDPDLGTPNQDFGGPGVGSGGRSGQPGQNAVARGKLLIISEDADSSDPDDNAGGGRLIFTFDVPVRVSEVSLVDIDTTEVGGTIVAFNAAGAQIALVPIPTFGDNSVQTVAVGATGVARLEVRLVGSGAVSKIVFCPADPDPCPPRIDFETNAAGASLPRGTIVTEQWAAQGIHVTTSDPTYHPAMIFDSAHPTGGDSDLGSPNQAFGGPGIGSGGGIGQPGQNALPLGKVLIISEDRNSSNPDDNAGGGTFIFTFDTPVTVTEVQILDVENTSSTVKAYNAAGQLLKSVAIPAMGDNGVRTVVVGADGVRTLRIRLAGSGALAAIGFCPHAGAAGGGPTVDQTPAPPAEEPATTIGAATVSFWQANPAVWPVGSLRIGGKTYTKQALVDVLGRPSAGNKALDLGKELVAAKLNVASGAPAGCIAGTIATADTWLASFGLQVGEQHPAWRRQGAALQAQLADYNNGRLCAPRR